MKRYGKFFTYLSFSFEIEYSHALQIIGLKRVNRWSNSLHFNLEKGVTFSCRANSQIECGLALSVLRLNMRHYSVVVS